VVQEKVEKGGSLLVGLLSNDADQLKVTPYDIHVKTIIVLGTDDDMYAGES
jgi:hypothetical protein